MFNKVKYEATKQIAGKLSIGFFSGVLSRNKYAVPYSIRSDLKWGIATGIGVGYYTSPEKEWNKKKYEDLAYSAAVTASIGAGFIALRKGKTGMFHSMRGLSPNQYV